MDQLSALQWGIKALQQIKKKYAYDANMARYFDATYPHAVKSLEMYERIEAAIKTLEEMKNGKQPNRNPN
jgi:hypothetical protein